MKKIVKLKKNKKAVSEALGTILLLGIAVAIFASLYFIVLSEQFETDDPIPSVVASVEGKYITFEHRGGDELNIDDKFIINIGSEKKELIVGDFLRDTNNNDKWDIGEKLFFDDFNYSLDISEADTFGYTYNEEGGTAVMHGTLDIYPETDIGVDIKVDNMYPSVGESVNITIIVHNYNGDINATHVKIKFLIPEGLEYQKHTPSTYNYNPISGFWYINDSIPIRGSISIKIQAKVLGLGVIREPTQMVMILDGSGSISDANWNIMVNGLANSVNNVDVFPRDGTIELTIVQFGGTDPPRARVELGGPTVVNESNYDLIVDDIRDIEQMIESGGSATPTACGIRLAADQLYNFGNYSSDKRQIINLVTDGLANCELIQGTYNGTWLGNGWYKDNSHKKSGSYSAASSYNNYGEIICKDLITEGASSISIDFDYRLDDTEESDLAVYYYDGTNYNFIEDLGVNKEDKWLHYEDEITDSKYFINDFKIRFDTNLESSWWYGYEHIWVDNVLIETDNSLLDDGFEQDPWNLNWWNFGKSDSEEQRDYLLGLLGMKENEDEFDSIAIGPDPEVYWLENKIVWPQPGYEAPPFNNGPGWVSHIDTFQEFESATSEMFRVLFRSIKNSAELVGLDSRDPNPFNDIKEITIVPQDK